MHSRKKIKVLKLIYYESNPMYMTQGYVSFLFLCLCSNKQALLTIPKPRYLEQLESYLRKELQYLDLTQRNSQELRLQV